MKIFDWEYRFFQMLRKFRVWVSRKLTPPLMIRYVCVLIIAMNIFFTRGPVAIKSFYPNSTNSKKVAASLASARMPRPVRLNPGSAGPDFLGKAALVVDATSSAVLYEKNSSEKLPPASLTKLMTALLILESKPLDQVTTVSLDCAKVDGLEIGLLPGQRFTVASLLKALLLPSAADAACALDESLEGAAASPSARFVQRMNRRAAELKLSGTHFTNPVGLDDTDLGGSNVSTAADLLTLTRLDLKFLQFSQIVSQANLKITTIDGAATFDLKNTNELLERDSAFRGIKTGSTPKALGCLVFLYERDGHQILGVILGSPLDSKQDRRFQDAQNLVKWIFENYRWE